MVIHKDLNTVLFPNSDSLQLKQSFIQIFKSVTLNKRHFIKKKAPSHHLLSSFNHLDYYLI